MTTKILTLLLAFSSIFSVSANTIHTGAVVGIEPYVFKETRSGIELEIFREALSLEGLNPIFTFQSSKRIYRELRNNKLDAGLTAVESTENKDLKFSDPYISYKNVAISLKSKGIKLNNVKGLTDLKVTAFQNAKIYLGEKYAEVVSSNKKYRETANVEALVKQLFSGKSEVIVMDKIMFNYIKNNTTVQNVDQQVSFHELFGENLMKVAFNSEKLVQKFNSGLKKLKKSGEYEKIINKYSLSKD